MVDDRPLVSIVTPSLDQGRYLADALRSVAQQDYSSIEHIVVDGGSTDETLDVLGRHDVRWVSEPDRGQADAINKGFRLATGEIFAWLNADDLYLPGAVAAAVDALQRFRCGLVYGAWTKIDDEGRTIAEVPVKAWDYRRLLEEANFVAQPTTFFTRAAFERVGGLDTHYRYALDHDLWLKIGKEYDVRPIDRPLAAFRVHAGSKSVAEADSFAAEVVRVSRRHGGRRFSRYYVENYLPSHRPWTYRLVLGLRLLRRGQVGELARLARARLRAPAP